MQSASPSSRPSPALHVAYAQGSGTRANTGTSFGAVLADVTSTPAGAAPPLTTGSTTHTVGAGETLYGIANARLASSGKPADPGASMRYALRIAQANGIRDPNRIYVGQSLDLAIGGSASKARADSVASMRLEPASIDVRNQGTRMALGETRIIEDDGTDDADQLAFDIPHASPLPSPALPASHASDAIRPRPEPDAVARNAIARYSETAAVTATRPADPVVSQPARDGAESSDKLPDIFYKGLLGKALDALPLDQSARTGLQQANAVIGSSFAGRSLAALTGIGGPLLTLAGLAWGIFSARKIAADQPADTTAPPQRPALAAVRE